MTATLTKPAATEMAASKPGKLKAPEHLDFLDGIRGGAALWVLVSHCGIWGGWRGIPLPSPSIAVDVFMVVSGYLMMHLGLQRAQVEPPGRPSTAFRFWVRRFCRIAPVYYLILAFAFAAGHYMISGLATLQAANPEHWTQPIYRPDNLHYTPVNFLMHVSFLFGFSPAYCAATLTPDWSIGLEMQFYAAFPLFLALFSRIRPLAAAALLFAASIAFNHLTQWYFGAHAFLEPSFLPLKLSLFLVGMTLASARREMASRRMDAFLMIGLALLFASRKSPIIVLLVLVFVLMMTEGFESDNPTLARLRAFCGKILGNRLTRFMGDMSYSVYLTHMFVILLLGSWIYRQPFISSWSLPQRVALLTVITLILGYAAAYLLHIFVEKPGMELGRRILKNRLVISPVPQPVVASPVFIPTKDS